MTANTVSMIELDDDSVGEVKLGLTPGSLNQSVCQISVTAFNLAGGEFVPSQGRLRVWIIPVGSIVPLAGDTDLDLATGEFFRPFDMRPSTVQAQHLDADPNVSKLIVRITAV